MPSDRLPSDRVWHWIDEQKRPSREARDGDEPALYSHDAEHNWIQAVSSAMRMGAPRPTGRRDARRRLVRSIRRSLRASYPHPRRRPALPERVLHATVAVVLLLTAMATTILLIHAVLQ